MGAISQGHLILLCKSCKEVCAIPLPLCHFTQMPSLQLHVYDYVQLWLRRPKESVGVQIRSSGMY